MNCADAREHLPWSANGSLPPEEESALREHLAGCPACAAEAADVRLAGGLFASHPEPEALVALAFADGSAESDGPDGALAAHLIHCSRCREELAMVRASRHEMEVSATPPAAPRPRLLAITALAAGIALCALLGWFWASQQTARERAAGAQREAALRTEVDRLGRPARESRPAQPPAAPLAEPHPAAAAAGERIARLEDELERLRQPRAGVPIVEVMAAEWVLRGSSAEPVRVRADQGATLALIVEAVAAGETYRVLIERGARTVFTLAAPASTSGEVTLHLPAGAMLPGSYEIAVLTAGGHKIGSFALEVR